MQTLEARKRILLRAPQFITCFLTFFANSSMVAAEKFALAEKSTDERTLSIALELQVDGQLQTSIGGGKALGLKLSADAQFRFHERRLPGTGRDAKTLRSIRLYDSAAATIKVNDQSTRTQLNPRRRLIVAHGKREGPVLYSPTGALNSDQLDLLTTPGDSLSVLGLLPANEVEVGQEWQPQSWVIQMLTATDAVLKHELVCRLESVESAVAEVSFSGKIEGAIAGASTNISIEGHYQFDLNQKCMTHVKLTQTEKRSVGTVSPGMDVTAIVEVTRTSERATSVFDKSVLAKIPFEPSRDDLKLQLDPPWRFRLFHHRSWHVFHQTREVAVLRLLDKGSLIAQCNVSLIPAAAAGKHTPEEQFQSDILSALGDKLKSITKAEQIKTDDGMFLFRVTAAGEAGGIPMHWFYHLCAAPTGHQAAFVFSVETKMLERFGQHDVKLVKSVRFLPVAPLSANKKP